LADAQILGQITNVNNNLAALTKAMTNAFVGNAATGTFTMAAAASKTVTDANVTASSYVAVFPINAAAATLQGSAKCLYTAAASGSFTAATASGGNAAGTESFAYLVLNLA
jgi:predicted trehalose synthase